MSDAPMAGGKRRIDQVLGDGFAQGLETLDEQEVHRRRDLARAELDYLSFLRRLVQGRRDILRDEQQRRRTGGEPIPVVDRLVKVLSEGGRGSSRGDAPVVPMPEEETMLARRRVERLVSDTRLSDLDSLSDEALEEAISRLEDEERATSDTRARVIEVHDALQDEVGRRYRDHLGNAAT
jgi:hypothetical protein